MDKYSGIEPFVEFAINDAEIENPIFDIKKATFSFWQDASTDNKY
jgi:hypothetical protein